MTDIKVQPLAATDAPMLREMLYHALYVPPGSPPFPREKVDDPAIARYVEGWMRKGDAGFKALNIKDDQAVGACWLRRWRGEQRGFGYIDEQTPELSIAVLPAFRGSGIGTHLLRRTLEAAAERHDAVSLSVAVTNPVARLYRRAGFVTVREDDGTLLMQWRRRSDPKASQG